MAVGLGLAAFGLITEISEQKDGSPTNLLSVSGVSIFWFSVMVLIGGIIGKLLSKKYENGRASTWVFVIGAVTLWLSLRTIVLVVQ